MPQPSPAHRLPHGLTEWKEVIVTRTRIAVSTAGNLQLPAPQRAEVKPSSSESVEMTLYCAADELDQGSTPVSIPLAPEMARDLAIRLWLAADETQAPEK